MRFRSFLYIILMSSFGLTAQVVTSQPPYPTVSDSIVIIFNAAEGNQGLMGYTGTDVYAHTGLITNLSSSDTDWKHVIADWNTNLPKAKLTKIGTDLWKLTIGHIDSYYGINLSQETVKKLAFVFRNSTGTKEGKEVGNTDIFHKIYNPGIEAVLASPHVETLYGIPERSPAIVSADSVLRIVGTAAVIETSLESLSLSLDEMELETTGEDTLIYFLDASDLEPGIKYVHLTAVDTNGIVDSLPFCIMINPPAIEEARPPDVVDGINYFDDYTVTLSLFAPYKDFVYIIGEFNDWEVDENYFMKRQTINEDSVLYWLTLTDLIPGKKYAFQYLVDGEIRIADPYADIVLDPWNDPYITDNTYPGLPSYPVNKTSEIVSVFQTNQVPYTWEVTEFERPEPQDLVIYELLVRDFIAAHDYKTLVDTLDYLENLGINAIELMPVNEFEGNESWGYNPSFYFAPDKYYGPAGNLKRFIDECHKRGIAVIMDMVLNHSYGQSPLVRLYNEGNYGQPLPQNPWYNVTTPHEFSFGYDFNHERKATQAFVDRVNQYWLEEYRIDGFRFDFTKGFTNRTGSGWNYDASRVAFIKRMADQLWTVSPGAYVILEHWTANDEEKALADYGMMLWGHANQQDAEWGYYEAAMGYHDAGKSDFSWGYFKTRGWSSPHLVTYMESHDEERVMFKNLSYGNASGDYDIQDLPTALSRVKMAAAFFFTIPGPKMIWQFGELGYDYSIGYNGRIGNKPIRWDYLNDENRRKLCKTFSALINMRHDYSTFRDPETFVELSVVNEAKRIKLQNWYMKAVIIGNFGVTAHNIDPSFHSDLVPRWWYDFFSGDSMYVTDVHTPIQLEPGEFHIFTTIRLDPPEEGLLTDLEDAGRPVTALPFDYELKQNFPNPFNPETTIEFGIAGPGPVSIKVYNVVGQEVRTLLNGEMQSGHYHVRWDGTNNDHAPVASGVYIYRLNSGNYSATKKLILLR